MHGHKCTITRALNAGAMLTCADNTGAKMLQVISVIRYRGVKNRMPRAGIGDMCIVSVKKGAPEMRKQIMKAVVIRQKRPYRRPDGLMVCFEDNAAVLTDEFGVPKGTEVKGPVAKEVAERYGKIASAATIIV